MSEHILCLWAQTGIGFLRRGATIFPVVFSPWSPGSKLGGAALAWSRPQPVQSECGMVGLLGSVLKTVVTGTKSSALQY